MKKSQLIRRIDAALVRKMTPAHRGSTPGLDDLDLAAEREGEAVERARNHRLRHRRGSGEMIERKALIVREGFDGGVRSDDQ